MESRSGMAYIIHPCDDSTGDQQESLNQGEQGSRSLLSKVLRVVGS